MVILDSDAITSTYHPDQFSVERSVRFGNFIIDAIATRILIYGIQFFVPWQIISFTDGLLSFLISYLIFFLYYFTLEAATGKTLGKLITRTKVVNASGNRPDAFRIAGRTISRLIPFEAFSFFGNEPRGWHDTLSKTWVVKEHRN